MNGQTRHVVVKVAVLAGAVMCQLGDAPVVLQQGSNRVFAGEKEDAKGVVAAKTELSLTLKTASGREITFYVPKSKALVVREVSQLNVGDEAAVIWIEEEGKKWIQDIIAKGVIEGVVTGLGDIWIEVKPKGKKAVRLIPPWLEATENRDGGLDREVLKKLGQTRVGDRVLVNWAMPEGQRVMALKVLERDDHEEDERDVVKGVIEGVVTGLGDQWIEVTAEGQDPVRMIPPWRDGGLDREVLKKLGAARVGDQVSLTWAMIEGKRVVDLKVLERDGNEGTSKDVIPAGLRGFEGVLFGNMVEKNEKKGTFTLKVQKVGRVWKANRAERAEEAIGKSLPIELHGESRLLDQHRKTLQTLNNDDLVEVEVFHLKDGVLSVIELLKKIDKETD